MELFYVLAGGYLIAVAYQGNMSKLLSDLQSESSFIWWIVALGILWGMSENQTLKPFVVPVGTLGLLAYIITAAQNPSFLNQFSQLKNQIGNVGG